MKTLDKGHFSGVKSIFYIISISIITRKKKLQASFLRSIIMLKGLTRFVEFGKKQWIFTQSHTVFPKQGKGVVLRIVNSDRDRENGLRELCHCQERSVILSVDQDT